MTTHRTIEWDARGQPIVHSTSSDEYISIDGQIVDDIEIGETNWYCNKCLVVLVALKRKKSLKATYFERQQKYKCPECKSIYSEGGQLINGLTLIQNGDFNNNITIVRMTRYQVSQEKSNRYWNLKEKEQEQEQVNK